MRIEWGGPRGPCGTPLFHHGKRSQGAPHGRGTGEGARPTSRDVVKRIAAFGVRFILFLRLLMGGFQVGEDEAVTVDYFAGFDSDRGAEHRAGVDEGVELAVFTARVH